MNTDACSFTSTTKVYGYVYATKKGEMTNPSPEVAKAAASMKKKDAKDFASTKHKGLPEKKKKSLKEFMSSI